MNGTTLETQRPGLRHGRYHDESGPAGIDPSRGSDGDLHGETGNFESGRWREPKANLTVRKPPPLPSLAPSTIRLYIRKRQLKAQKVGRRVIIAGVGP